MLLEFVWVRDIGCHGQETINVSRGVAGWRRRNEQFDRSPIPASPPGCIVRDGFTSQGSLIEKVGFLALVLADKRHPSANDFAGGPTENPGRCSIPDPHTPLAIHSDNGVRTTILLQF